MTITSLIPGHMYSAQHYIWKWRAEIKFNFTALYPTLLKFTLWASYFKVKVTKFSRVHFEATLKLPVTAFPAAAASSMRIMSTVSHCLTLFPAALLLLRAPNEYPKTIACACAISLMKMLTKF